MQTGAAPVAPAEESMQLGQDPLQLGATFIFAPGNIDRWAHISQTFGDNATPETILAALNSNT